MKRKIMRIIFFFESILLFCCNQMGDKKNKYESYELNFGNERMVLKYHQDSVNIEHVSVFDQDSILYKSFKLIDGLKNGIERGFFPSGNVRYKSIYKNDTLQGESIWYYNSGRIKSVYHYDQGRIAGNQMNFNENGDLTRYFSTNYNEEITFDIQYDEKGNEKQNALKSSYKIMGVFDDFIFNTNDSIRYVAHFSTPKNINIKYYYAVTPVEMQNDVFRQLEITDSKVFIDTLIDHKGIYIIKEKMEIIDNRADTMFYENFSYKIEIK